MTGTSEPDRIGLYRAALELGVASEVGIKRLRRADRKYQLDIRRGERGWTLSRVGFERYKRAKRLPSPTRVSADDWLTPYEKENR